MSKLHSKRVKITQIYSLFVLEVRTLKSKGDWQCCILPDGSKKESFPFPAFRGHPFFGSQPLPLSLCASPQPLLPSSLLFLTLILLLSSSKDPYNYIGPTWIMQDNFSHLTIFYHSCKTPTDMLKTTKLVFKVTVAFWSPTSNTWQFQFGLCF